MGNTENSQNSTSITFWDKLLIHPETGESLGLNLAENLSTDKKFSIQLNEKIVEFFPIAENDLSKSTSLHKNSNSTFNYVEHYNEDAEHFDYFAMPEDELTQKEAERLHQFILSQIPINAKLILDVGSGGAWLSKQLLPKGKQIISMDISRKNVHLALEKNSHENHYGLVADVYQLPIKDNSIDCIVASEIMEHVSDPKLFIKQLTKKLTKGGKLIITTPYNEKLTYHLCVHCNRPTPSNAHLHSFNENNIKALVPPNINDWQHKTFSNKYGWKSRLYKLANFLSFNSWKNLDKILNTIKFSPSRLLIAINK